MDSDGCNKDEIMCKRARVPTIFALIPSRTFWCVAPGQRQATHLAAWMEGTIESAVSPRPGTNLAKNKILALSFFNREFTFEMKTSSRSKQRMFRVNRMILTLSEIL